MTPRTIDLGADDRAVPAADTLGAPPRHPSRGALHPGLVGHRFSGAGDAPVGHRFSGALVWFGAWTALVVMQATAVSAQRQVLFRYALMSSAVNYYTLALLSVAVWRVSAWLSAYARSRSTMLCAHVALAVVVIALWQGTYAAYLYTAIGPRVWDVVYRSSWPFQILNAVVLYTAVAGAMLAVQSAARERLHEQRQHALALLARDAELRALNAQLEPHFLLNTLNSVMALIDRHPPDARLMLERLAELLKAAFDETEEAVVPLGRELDLIEAYLGIEQIRFADRLRVSVDVAASLRGVPVPPFLLQPIVENAIKHGLAPFGVPGSIAIVARRIGHQVRIDVTDSGPGFDDPAAAQRGHGLWLTERRLLAYAPAAALTFAREAAGFTVAITLPA